MLHNQYISKGANNVISTLCKLYRVKLHYRNVYYTPLTLPECFGSYTNIVTSMLRNDYRIYGTYTP